MHFDLHLFLQTVTESGQNIYITWFFFNQSKLLFFFQQFFFSNKCPTKQMNSELQVEKLYSAIVVSWHTLFCKRSQPCQPFVSLVDLIHDWKTYWLKWSNCYNIGSWFFFFVGYQLWLEKGSNNGSFIYDGFCVNFS